MNYGSIPQLIGFDRNFDPLHPSIALNRKVKMASDLYITCVFVGEVESECLMW